MLQIQENVALAPLTTLQVGGAARFFAEVISEEQMVEALAFAGKYRLPVFPLGGGSNLLVHDEGFPGLVLHLRLQGATRTVRLGDEVEQTVAAGKSWDEFVQEACAEGLSGVECLAGIPGLTGGTPVQNIGAYGQEVSQTITAVRAFDRSSSHFVTLSAADCHFSYRSSTFNGRARHRYLLSEVTFALRRGAAAPLNYPDLERRFPGEQRPAPVEVAAAVRAIRQTKSMLLRSGEADSRSAGSFFKNPVVSRLQFERIASSLAIDPAEIPHWPVPTHRDGGLKLAAAWLLERAGFHKGLIFGEVGLSSRHPLALINRTGQASCADVLQLRDLIVAGVLGRFGIELEQEPVELSPASVGSSDALRATV